MSCVLKTGPALEGMVSDYIGFATSAERKRTTAIANYAAHCNVAKDVNLHLCRSSHFAAASSIGSCVFDLCCLSSIARQWIFLVTLQSVSTFDLCGGRCCEVFIRPGTIKVIAAIAVVPVSRLELMYSGNSSITVQTSTGDEEWAEWNGIRS